MKLMLLRVRNFMSNFVEREEGVGVVELILILVVLIGLVVIFQTQITTIVNNIFTKITSGVSKIK